MNKKLLALAIAGVFAAPLAAQAEVSIYGVAHVSVDSLDDDNNTDGLFVSSNSSRIGFKGSEDIGGGLKGIWQIESLVNLDESGGQLATRNSFLGVAGGFGAVLFGRHDTPMKLVSRKVDLFGDTIGDSRNITGASDVSVVGFDARPNNVVAYASPNMNGLQALVAYVTEDGVDDASAMSANVTYGNGPLWVGAAYESHGEGISLVRPGIPVVSTGEEESAWRLAASYEMGAFKVTGMYDSYTDVAGVSGLDTTAWGLGAAFSMGNNVVKAQWYTIDAYDGTDETGSDMWAIGLDHNFSKTTTGYLAYAQTSNDDAAARGMSGGGHGDSVGSALGGDATGFSLGMIHKF